MKIWLVYLLLLMVSLSPKAAHANHQGCLTAGFWVENKVVNYFNPKLNPESENSFDEWAKKQMDAWNEILSKSGVEDCFKIGKIVQVRDNGLPLTGKNDPYLSEYPTNFPNINDLTTDVVWGFPAKNLADEEFWKPLIEGGIDWGLLHELSHARYLTDQYAINIHLSRDVIEVTDDQGKPVVGNYLKPNKYNDLYFNKADDLMANHYDQHFYSAHSALALNLIAHKHTKDQYGNYNAPDNLGVYLNDLPNENFLQVLDADSKPLKEAKVRIYQSVIGDTNEMYSKKIDNVADIEDVTDDQGNVNIGKNPFGGENIDSFEGNLVLLLGVTSNNQSYFKILEVTDFNLAYWQGAREEATFVINTNIKQSTQVSPTPTLTPTPIQSIPTPTSASQLDASCQVTDITIPLGSNLVTVSVSGKNLIQTGRNRYTFNFFTRNDVNNHSYTTVIPPETQTNTFDGRGSVKLVVYAYGEGTAAPAILCGEKIWVEATPTPTPAPTPAPTPIVNNQGGQQIIVSNNPNFADPNQVVINNTTQTQEVPVNINSNQPIYIRNESDGTITDYETTLNDGQTTTVPGTNVTIEAQVVKKVTKVKIGDREYSPEDLDSEIEIDLDDFRDSGLNVPIEIEYDDGSKKYLGYHFNLPEERECPDWKHLRNECTGCGKARSVYEDQCTDNTDILEEDVDDEGCNNSDWCEEEQQQERDDEGDNQPTICTYSETPRDCPGEGTRVCTGTNEGQGCHYNPDVDPNCEETCNEPPPQEQYISECGQNGGDEYCNLESRGGDPNDPNRYGCNFSSPSQYGDGCYDR